MTRGIIITAASTFVFGALLFSFMLYILILEQQHTNNNTMMSAIKMDISSHHLQHAFGPHFDKTSIDLIVSFLLIISLLTMIFSILLVIGIKKKKPSLIVGYFSFGSLLCLLLVIAAVLELVHSLWTAGFFTAVFALGMPMRLSAVYSEYENMEKEFNPLLLEESELNE